MRSAAAVLVAMALVPAGLGLAVSPPLVASGPADIPECDAGICHYDNLAEPLPLRGDCPATVTDLACDLDGRASATCFVAMPVTCPSALRPCGASGGFACHVASLAPLVDDVDGFTISIPVAGMRLRLNQWPLMPSLPAPLDPSWVQDYWICADGPGGHLESKTVGGQATLAFPVPGRWALDIEVYRCPPFDAPGAVAGPAIAPPPGSTRAAHWVCYPACIGALPTSYSLGFQ